MSREDRVNGILVGALDGVAIDGAALLVEGSAQAAEALAAAGLQVRTWRRYGAAATELPPEGLVDRVALRQPKGRRNLEAMVAVAASRLAPGGRFWLYGSNDEGIRSAGRSLSAYFDQVETVDSRGHARLWQATGRADTLPALDSFLEHGSIALGDREVRYQTLPGVFAAGRLDDGTRLLLSALQIAEGASVLDFGCGAGAIGALLGDRVSELTGVDVDAWALRCARVNAPGTYHLCDGLDDVQGSFDHIISNPPFHVGKDTDFDVIGSLICGAPPRLRKGGRLTLVCPVTAAIGPQLRESFSNVRVLRSDGRYRVWEAR